MRHKIKVLSSFVYPILHGEKTFEIRENDRGYQKGDIVEFEVVSDEWTDKNRSVVQELQCRSYEITYVINGWGLKNGYVVFGISEVSE